MRQVLVSRHHTLEATSGSKVKVKVTESTQKALPILRVTLLRMPLKLNVLTGGDLDVKFEITRELAEAGVMLVGAYFENDEVTAAVMSCHKELTLETGTLVLNGTLVETVRYRQIDQDVAGNLTIESKSEKKVMEVKKKPKKGKK